MGVFSDRSLPATASSEVLMASKRKEFSGKEGQWTEAFPANMPRILLVGLGEFAAFNESKAREAGAVAGRRLAQVQARTAQFEMDRWDDPMWGRALGEALGLLAWNPMLYPGAAAKPDNRPDLSVFSSNETLDNGLADGIALAEAANFARTLAQTPPNIANPAYMAEAAREMAAERGLKVDVLSDEYLLAAGYVGIATVGRASANPGCLIRIEYCPEGLEDTAPVVLVGKTITYDTGGLSLKISGAMAGMKVDKAGGCAVLGAMRAIADVVKPNVRVVGLLTAAENSVSDDAYRPDDVLTYSNGVTVEVTNTDAEGRLVLADGLIWACDREKAKCIVDLATLTGGVVVALGSTFAGIFSTDDSLCQDLTEAGQATGERVWRLPLDQGYRDMMKSNVADLVNSVPNRKAHPVQGATFLSFFVNEGTPWAHIDIAGTAGNDSDKGMFVNGPTGFGVRLLARYLETHHG